MIITEAGRGRAHFAFFLTARKTLGYSIKVKTRRGLNRDRIDSLGFSIASEFSVADLFILSILGMNTNEHVSPRTLMATCTQNMTRQCVKVTIIPPIQGAGIELTLCLFFYTFIRGMYGNIPNAAPLTDPTMKNPTARPRTTYSMIRNKIQFGFSGE